MSTKKRKIVADPKIQGTTTEGYKAVKKKKRCN